MSDIKLFSVASEEAQAIELKPVKLEKDVQLLVERNMETFFGVRFLASEFVITHTDVFENLGGRIDSLGIDENNCPIVFEYKRDSSENVINQGLFYLDWLLDHKAEFQLLVMKELGVEAAEKIDWSSPAVYCIANMFGKYDLHAVKQMNRNIRLIRYSSNSDLVMFEFLNSVSTSAPKLSNATDSHQSIFAQQLASAPEAFKEIVSEDRGFMANLGSDVSESELKYYLAIKKVKNIVCVDVNSKRVGLHLALSPTEDVLSGFDVTDDSGKGHFGTGDVGVALTKMEHLEAIKPLLERVYLEN